MCRLYGFISNEPSKVDCSLVYAQNALMLQSRVDESGRGHADGWGIATYENGRPFLKKKTTAAFDDQHFSTAAEKTYSKVIIAHVRKATVGRVSIENTHPFVSGRWTFAHNGTVTGFAEFRSRMEDETAPDLQRGRLGETDSEQFFLWLLTRLRRACLDDFDTASESDIVELLSQSVTSLYKLCREVAPDKTPRLNFVLTDGTTLAACRWNHSLHMIRREGIYACEICGIPHIHHLETVAHRAVAVASEPVTHERWQEVNNHQVFVVRA